MHFSLEFLFLYSSDRNKLNIPWTHKALPVQFKFSAPSTFLYNYSTNLALYHYAEIKHSKEQHSVQVTQLTSGSCSNCHDGNPMYNSYCEAARELHKRGSTGSLAASQLSLEQLCHLCSSRVWEVHGQINKKHVLPL